ncbi:hypothetical protein BHM03_00057750 [Ensete ventricosum]|nr:hypothetical protein BHM03_00057750 [Ensete ventricosum]
MLGQSQVRASGQGLDDVVGIHREITGSSLKVSKGLQRIRQELAQGDWGLAGSSLAAPVGGLAMGSQPAIGSPSPIGSMPAGAAFTVNRYKDE